MEWLMANWLPLLGAIVVLLSGVIGILKLIPGNQGEGILEKIKNLLSKFLPGK